MYTHTHTFLLLLFTAVNDIQEEVCGIVMFFALEACTHNISIHIPAV